MKNATFESFADAKKFFYDVKNEAGEKEGKRMGSLRTACVVITTPFGDKVAFMKTSANRSGTYRDSRGKKTEKKNEWGEKIVGIAPLMITGDELKAELSRLLGCDSMAYEAFRALQV